ncbi:MAG: hypothetical protein WDA11_14115 [Thiohalomonadaceae bacterium]
MAGPRTELEQLTQDIKHGRKVLLFPPGLAVFVSTIMLALFGFASTMILGFRLVSEAPIEIRAVAQLVCTTFVLPGVVLPGLMIVRGNKQFVRWIRWFGISSSLVAFVIAAYQLTSGDGLAGQWVLLSGALLGGASAAWLSRTPRFILFCKFFYLLKKVP